MYVIDLKYGKGVKVSAYNNSQLGLYGLGAYLKYSLSYDITAVKMVIMQPRLDNISEFEQPVDDLIDWAENEVRPKAELAFEGKGEQVAGKWCQFCKVKATCRALADHNLQIAKEEFAEIAELEQVGKKFKANPAALSDEELLEIYEKIPLLTFWANAVNAHILQTALDGKKWEGLKLVEGRATRKWKDEDEVIRRLREAEFGDDQILTVKLNGLTAVQKLLGKKEFDVMLEDLIIRPEGKPTLAPVSDPRKELNSSEKAAEDFAGIK